MRKFIIGLAILLFTASAYASDLTFFHDLNIGNHNITDGDANTTTAADLKTAYDHSQLTSGNPHNVTKTDVGLANVTDNAQYYAGGTDVAVADGGTGKSSWTQYLIPYADTTTSFSQISIGDAGQVLTSNGAGSAPEFKTPAGGNVTYSKSFVITNPSAASDSPLWRVPANITITAVHVLCVGGTNIVGQLWEYDDNGANGATVDSSDITGTAGSNVDDDGTLSNSGVASGNYLGWKTTSVSEVVTQGIISFDYTID